MPGRRGSESESDSAHTEYIGTFETLRDEGEHFVHVAQYRRAIDSFSKALEMKGDDKQCLVARSQCFLHLGNARTALDDAEAVLEQDETYIQAIYQKAQALYQIGDFETALVFYHRGNQLRPEMDEFRLGIQKCQEAITNSIGVPESIKLECESVDLMDFYQSQESAKKAQPKGGYQKPIIKAVETRHTRAKKLKPENEKTIKQLLGELYEDKEFLESLIRDESITGHRSRTGLEVKNLVVDCLDYLDTRTDFWRQQKPLYAQKRDRDLRFKKFGGEKKPTDLTKYFLKQLQLIENAQTDSKYEESLKLCKKAMSVVEGWSTDQVPNKHEIMANLHSLVGTAYLEIGDTNTALYHHQQDMKIGEDTGLEEAQSRALENLGRVYARCGSYDKALEVWMQKLPMDRTAMESTWLYHEIGRCYLELGDFQSAKDYGNKSLDSARDAEDKDWQLHATVLIAQSEVKLEELHLAITSFEQALDLAKEIDDKQAEQALKNAIADVNKKIIKSVNEAELRNLPDDAVAPSLEIKPQETEQEQTEQKHEETKNEIDKVRPPSAGSASSHSSRSSSDRESRKSSSHSSKSSSKSSPPNTKNDPDNEMEQRSSAII